MDVDDEEMDELAPLKSSTRGRKRDRAEAGSTFGGDEDRSDVEVEGDEKTRKRRKRRTIVKRKTGGKRDEEHFSEEESPIKKGKGSPEQSVSDISMDDSAASVRSKGRNIGDEWETNGIKYKIGPNGQRLRQALVKKARQKFNMPQDSQHPDRDQHFNIYIETWLTEEEYKEAKKQRILAWQDSPNKEPLTVNTLLAMG
ncbi:hypothetical protein CPC08DRAFT_134987 [Agrocybe pediades]|nr:hypothetical protein CPC08DRAFT_134987 [Agrocybe pediades]